MPSTTRKVPRSTTVENASSLLLRTRPGSLAPAHFSMLLTIRRASEIQIQDAGQPDTRPRRQWCFLLRSHARALNRGAQAAHVGQEELAGGGIAPQPEMFARN